MSDLLIDGKWCPVCGVGCCYAEVNAHHGSEYVTCPGGCTGGVVHYLEQFRDPPPSEDFDWAAYCGFIGPNAVSLWKLAIS